MLKFNLIKKITRNKSSSYFLLRQFCEKKQSNSKRNVKTEEEEQVEANVNLIDTLMEISKSF